MELARLINKEGVMQVGNWVVKLNFEDKLVRVIGNDQKKKLYQKLIKEQQDKDIYVFSFEDEVFALLDEGFTSSPTLASAANGRVNGLCFGGGISEPEGHIAQNAHSTCTNQPPLSFNPNTATYVRGTNYNKYGVYFELNAFVNAYVTPQYANIFDPCLVNGNFTANIYWRSNCNGNTGIWPSNPNQTYVYNLTFVYQGGSELYFTQQWGVYSGSRGIRCLQVSDFSLTTQNAPWIGGSSNFSGVCP
jgi:hypothetical protein